MLTPTEKILDQKAKKFSRHIRYGEGNLTNVLIDIARSKFYHRLEFKNLGKYIQGRLEIQGDYAYALATVANRATELNALEDALRSGRLSRCFASRILSVIDAENQEEIVEFACTHTFDEVNAFVNRLNCGDQFKERLRDLGENHKRLMCDFNDAEIDLLKRVQSIEAQAHRPVTIRNAIVASWRSYLKQNCKVEKAERAFERKAKAAVKENAVSPAPEPKKPVSQKPSGKRVPLTAAQQHAVNHKTQGRCVWIKKGSKRCNSPHITETHHIVSVADGGTNEPSNLTTLCWFHHALLHELKSRELPLPKFGQTKNSSDCSVGG